MNFRSGGQGRGTCMLSAARQTNQLPRPRSLRHMKALRAARLPRATGRNFDYDKLSAKFAEENSISLLQCCVDR